ncbi:MAG: serine/threonine protein kinase [Candidatus Saganbacteria bacterium]|nr:serine/threonine protein kinase [Candidatus Saganbacteria bacterium]
MITPSIWQELNHDSILNAVEAVLPDKLSNLLLKRNSYINRVYELEKLGANERIIVKFYRPGRWTREMILEEHQFLKDLAAKEISVIPPLQINNQTLFSFNDIPFALFPKKGGRALDEFDEECWEEIGRILARVHLVGALHKESQRIAWKPSIATAHHLEVLLQTEYLLPDFKKAFKDIAEMFIKKADPFFARHEFILLHGDCHKGNLIHRPGEGIFLVDFDDICVAPPVQDLWLLLPDKPEKCENEIAWFLKGYETFRAFDRSSLELIPFLRGMRIIHFASWLAVQSKEFDFSTHFPEAGTPRYWNELIKELQGIIFSE